MRLATRPDPSHGVSGKRLSGLGLLFLLASSGAASPAADPAGQPACPIPHLRGQLGVGSPDWPVSDGEQTGRVHTDGVRSSCAAPKAFPGFGAMTGARTFDAWAFHNPHSVAACVSVLLTVDAEATCNMMAVAYLGEYDPEDLDLNYLADPGLEAGVPPGAVVPFTFLVGAGESFVIVVNDVDGIADAGCRYTLDVTGLCPVAPHYCQTVAGTFVSTNVPLPIPNSLVATSTVEVSGAGSFLLDVNVLTDIIHSYNADLDLTIEAPNGRVVTLTTDNGGELDDVFHGTLWDDQADADGQVPYTSNAGLVTDHPFEDEEVASWLSPEEPLAAFYGINPNGTWTLTASDDAPQDSGALLDWSLQITAQLAPPGTSFLATVSNPTPMPIPTGPAVVTSTIDFTGLRSTRICGGVRAFLDVTHTASSNLDMTLRSPQGTVATISTDNGGSNDDVFAGTQWSSNANTGGQVPYDSNPGLTTDHPYVDATPVADLAPEESFGVFAGEDPRGVWTLTISDDTVGEGGMLNSWNLTVAYCSCATAIPAPPVYVDAHALPVGTSNVNGVAEMNETFEFSPSWTNAVGVPLWLAFAAVTAFDGPPGPTYTIPNATADYGLIPAGATANCYDATGNVYFLAVEGARPAVQHLDAGVSELVAESTIASSPGAPSMTKVWRLHVGESFADVPTAHPFYRFIENIFHNGVTGGCGGANYCPGNETRRDQMAVFVLRAAEGLDYLPPACADLFADVDCPGPFADWIEELANRGVVAGCGGGNYCPDAPVLRQQMAVFLLRTLLGSSYVPPDCTDLFDDVPCTNPFAAWIEDLFSRGITGGCGGDNYCPASVTTRGQMAVFLERTFGLLLYGP